MLSTYIVQAKILGYRVKGEFVIVDFLLPNGIKGQIVRAGPIAKTRYKVLKKAVGQQIQVKAYSGMKGFDGFVSSEVLAVPTFFDFRSRCKKCGRFYKVYCRHCYQEFKWVNITLDRFEEYMGGIRNVANIKKIR